MNILSASTSSEMIDLVYHKMHKNKRKYVEKMNLHFGGQKKSKICTSGTLLFYFIYDIK